MIETMMLGVPSRMRAPEAGAKGGAGARGRTEATAGSFEDVLRKLDRSGQPRTQDRPAGRPVEDGARPTREATGRASGEGQDPAGPEAERAGESEEVGSTGPATAPPASQAAEATPPVAAGVAGHAALIGEAGSPPPAAPPAAAPAGTGSGAPDLPSFDQGGLGLMAGVPVQAPEGTVASAVAVLADVAPAPQEDLTATGTPGPDAAGARAGDSEGASLHALRGALVAEAGPKAQQAAAGETVPRLAPEGGMSPGERHRSQMAQGRAAVREGGAAVPAGADARAGAGGREGMVPLSRLVEEAGLTVAGEGSAAPVQEEGARAGARGPRAVQSVAAEAMIQAPASEGPAPVEGGATSATTQGTAMSPAQTEAPTSVPHEATVHPARQGAAFASTPMAQVGDLVLKRLQQLRSPGSDELRLELEPRELGSLKIRLELQGDGVKAQFVVDRPVVQAMLERAMAELRQNLLEQGYRVDELQVALQDDGQARGQGGERGSRAGSRPASGLRLPEAVVPEVDGSGWISRAGPGRIDIRV